VLDLFLPGNYTVKLYGLPVVISVSNVKTVGPLASSDTIDFLRRQCVL